MTTTTRIKRSANDDYEHDGLIARETEYISQNCGVLGMNREKRARVGAPPLVVGPLTFDSNGEALHRALIPAQESPLPGVYRLAASPFTHVRLWSSQWPGAQFLESLLSDVLESIDQKCIFIFDDRKSEQDSLLHGAPHIDAVLNHPTVRNRGIIVSAFPPPGTDAVPIAFVQDPSGELAKLCKFSPWLGPCAVLVKDNQVVSTLMLQRKHDALVHTLHEWARV